MRHALLSALLLLGALATTGCHEDVTQPWPENDLVGLWNLPYQGTGVASIYGYQSAQVIFSEDGTFLFLGASMLSSHDSQDYRVEGTWSRTGDSVTLEREFGEPRTSTYLLTFDGYEVTFADPDGGETFTLFRPGPD